MSPTVDQILAVLTAAQDRLAAAVQPLPPERLTGPAYPTEWSITQVMSHLGLKSEFSVSTLGPDWPGGAGPRPERFQRIWNAWNAKAPDQQVADSISAAVAFRESIAR